MAVRKNRSTTSTTFDDDDLSLRLIGVDPIDGVGNALDNWMIGNTAANTLSGLAGNDRLNGERGADRLIGGEGNDIYFVDDAADRTVELDGQGVDSVKTSISWTLAAFTENLVLTGDEALNATGNSAANRLRGNAGDNVIAGLGGKDMIIGGLGIDTALYTGAFADYAINHRVGRVSSVAEGIDRLDGIEKLRFADGVYDWATRTFQADEAPKLDIGAQTDALIEKGMAGDGVNAAAIQLTASDAEGATRFGTEGWQVADFTGSLLVKNGIYGSATLDIAAGAVTFTLDNSRDATNGLSAGDVATDSFSVTVRDDSGMPVTETVTFTITGDDDNVLDFVEVTGLTINGSAGDDTISFSVSSGSLPRATERPDTISGLDGNDTLGGGPANDRLYGGAGNDIINGNLQNDTLDGGVGNDKLYGDAGDDHITGVLGNDQLFGGANNDTLIGGPGSDRLDGGDNTDIAVFLSKFALFTIDRTAGTVTRGLETDVVLNVETLRFQDGDYNWATGLFTSNAPSYNTTITGTAAGDRLTLDATVPGQSLATSGNDMIDGRGGNDFLGGGDGDDLLMGAIGADSLFGGAGNDTLVGGLGKDTLTGGDGADTFVFDTGSPNPLLPWEADTIRGFDTSEDMIELDSAIFGALNPGRLPMGAFVADGGSPGPGPKIIYQAFASRLLYDADGSGSAQPIEFANFADSFGNLSGATLTLTAANFLIV